MSHACMHYDSSFSINYLNDFFLFAKVLTRFKLICHHRQVRPVNNNCCIFIFSAIWPFNKPVRCTWTKTSNYPPSALYRSQAHTESPIRCECTVSRLIVFVNLTMKRCLISFPPKHMLTDKILEPIVIGLPSTLAYRMRTTFQKILLLHD